MRKCSMLLRQKRGTFDGYLDVYFVYSRGAITWCSVKGLELVSTIVEVHVLGQRPLWKLMGAEAQIK